MPSDVYSKPRFFFNVSLPLSREPSPQRWFRLRKCSVGYFGPSPAKNTTWRLVFFGWTLCEWRRHEWHDASDKERAERYLAEWSKCEKELRGLRLLQLGDEVQDPQLRKLLRDGLGINLDEGTAL